MTTWITWNGSKVRHAAQIDPRDARLGSFPLECGRWAPDGWDKDITVAYHGKPCQKCSAAVSAKTASPA